MRKGQGLDKVVLCKTWIFNTAINIETSRGVIYSKTLGSCGVGPGQWAPGRMGCGRQGAWAAEENEGGWSIPEAAGANGCLLGCAGPTRGSFTQGSNPRRVGKGKNGTWKEE